MVLWSSRNSAVRQLHRTVLNAFNTAPRHLVSRGLSSASNTSDYPSSSAGSGSRRENAFGYATPDSQVSRKERHSKYKFVDKVQVAVSGGRGGNGCISFEVLSPGKKRPHGGNGGAGGDVYLVADPTLTSFTFQTFHMNAASGGHGGSDGQKGGRGRDLYVKVPLGTVVTERLEDFWTDAAGAGGVDEYDDDDDDDAAVSVYDEEMEDGNGSSSPSSGSGSDSDDSQESSDSDEYSEEEEEDSAAIGGGREELAPSLPVARLSSLVEPARLLEAIKSKRKLPDSSPVDSNTKGILSRAQNNEESWPLIDYSLCVELADLSALSPEEQRHQLQQKARMERRKGTKKEREKDGWILPSAADDDAFGGLGGEDISAPSRVSVDMDVPGVPLRVAVGGAPGLGNRAYSGTGSSRARSLPKSRLPGRAGVSRQLLLELRLIADVGLVGAPNAGKSSLLRALSNARPRVAPFAFSTLRPGLGVVEYSDLERITVADIPGLVPGASEDRGLGVAFLKHLLRTKVLVYVLDGAGSEGRDPLADLQSLLYEVAQFDEAMARSESESGSNTSSDSLRRLLKKPAIVFSNKADIEEFIPGCRALLRKKAANVFEVAMSAAMESDENEGNSRTAFGLLNKEVIEGSAMRGGPGVARLAVAMREAVEAVRAREQQEEEQQQQEKQKEQAEKEKGRSASGARGRG